MGVAIPALTGLALAFSILAFARRIRRLGRLPRPLDRSPAKGDPRAGVAYAFTTGMAPWAKESTRLHPVAYLRGIAFHLGIFLGLGVLLAGPWIDRFPGPFRLALAIATGIGALMGLAGFAARLLERNLRAISIPDDYAAVLLVTAFLGSASAALLQPNLRPAFFLFAAGLAVYAPFSKIRHCIYFAYSRMFFGRFIGRRGVIPHRPPAS